MRIDKEAIFCSVAAFNETYLLNTVSDAYEKSSNPDSLYFGIFNQKTKEKDFEDFSSFPNVRVIKALYDKPLGVGYARLSASMLHEGEKYFCQMDGHNLFAKDWDSLMLNDYKLLEQHVNRPILSQSICWHDCLAYENDQSTVGLTQQYPLTLDGRGDTQLYFPDENEEKFLGKFIEHGLMFACGEFFTTSKFIYEVSYDPFVMYLPDQELSALRAGTRGYRFFSSGKGVMSHLGKVNNPSFTEENYPEDFFFIYNSNENRSEDYYRSGYEMSAYASLMGKRLGFYGAPSIDDYENYMSSLKRRYSETSRDVYDNIEKKYSSIIDESEEVFYKNIY